MADLSVPQGAKREFTIPVTQGRGGADYDLTDATVQFTAKNRTSDADVDAVLTKAIGTGLTVADPTNGEVLLTFDPADTEDLAAHSALVYDVWVTEADDDPFLVQKGRIFVTPRVSAP